MIRVLTRISNAATDARSTAHGPLICKPFGLLSVWGGDTGPIFFMCCAVSSVGVRETRRHRRQRFWK